jgi:hypothetical protein
VGLVIASLCAVYLSGCGDAAPRWTMPDLVGRDLQSAQDTVQQMTGYAIAATVAHDATGAGRPQVVDRDWTVCTQSVPAGATIDPDSMIDFGVVQRGESC